MPTLSKIRIIGGKWRSRKISFNGELGIRPTTDRVRETVFNWLMQKVEDTSCLDLFAGSGTMGFEALSRGAKKVLMVDKSYQVICTLIENAKTLNTTNCSFLHALLPRDFKKIPSQQFNLVFIDPPFHQNLVKICCEKLIELNLLTDEAYVYIEAERELDLTGVVPATFDKLREKVAGKVRFTLWQKNYPKNCSCNLSEIV